MSEEKKPKYSRDEVMEISWDQEKLISNPFRSRLVALLYEQALTPKQAADMVEKNPGTVYYHIQQLLKHDILEVERTETNKGIVEKYYRAKAANYSNPERSAQNPAHYVTGANTHILMSDELLEDFEKDMGELFLKYGHLAYKEQSGNEQRGYTIEYSVKKFIEDDEK